MKYFIIIISLLPIFFSCSSKKNVAHTNPIRDTFYIMDPNTSQLSMHLVDENIDPSGSWTLRSINNSMDEEMQRVRLELNTQDGVNTISGNDACNEYSGQIKVFNKRQIEFGPLASTKRACFVPAKYAEIFYDRIEKVKSYNTSNKYLVLKDAEGNQLLEFVRKEKD